MAELSDIANPTIREEIEEFLERADEIERNVELFARARPLMQEIAVGIIDGDNDAVDRLTVQALDEGIDAMEVMDDGLIAGMGIVGIKFREAFIFVPEVLACARAMKAGMAHIEPILSAAGVKPIATVVMGTVKGDLHDIGKNLVCMMAEGAGFEVHDLGVDQSLEKFLAAAEAHKPDIVGMSALLTTTMTYMKTVIDGFEERGQGEIKMTIGGAPISQMYADEIAADGYGADASSAVDLFLGLVGKG